MIRVKVENLDKVFGEGETQVRALNDVNFSIDEKEYVVFMGPSGAGKSTLINLLAGLDTPTEGIVKINGSDLSSMSDSSKCDMRRYEIGIVFQFFNLHPGLTVHENIELPLVIAGISKKERPEKIKRVLKLTSLENRQKHYPFELSGGEQQRTAIARALVMKPSVLLCDEPTGDLDSENGQKIIDLLHYLNLEEDVTIIEVTHDESMLRLGDRLIQMEDGMIINDIILDNGDQIPKYEYLNNNSRIITEELVKK
ncbi:MAG: ABC transporter ATP-binding protein [Candidatus Hodarchaeales archaeon]|jgi:putative ABC transport system ATP-binding protein